VRSVLCTFNGFAKHYAHVLCGEFGCLLRSMSRFLSVHAHYLLGLFRYVAVG